jgi:hypothetical protein
LELTKQWQAENQKFLSVFGTLKFKEKATGEYFDGLDPEDSPEDYLKVYI